MKHILLILTLLFNTPLLFSQGDTLYFADAVKKDFRKFRKESTFAYRKGDMERACFLFDSLVEYRLRGSLFDDYTFKKAGGGKLKLGKVNKPIVFISYASWCVQSKGEIPALNRLAQKYGRDVKFVVLFWDNRRNARKAARKLSSHIIVCYANEAYRSDAPAIADLKKTLGFPVCYFLDANLWVTDIKRCGMKLCPAKTDYNKALALNYNIFLDGLTTILIDRELAKEHLATK